MPPNARVHIQNPDPWLHAFHLILTILRRKVQVGLAGQDERLRLDGRHGALKIAIVRLLQADIARLPGVEHDEQILGVLAQRPRLPEAGHEVLEILGAVHLLVQLLAVEGLAEAPAGVAAAEGLQAHRLLFVGPFPGRVGGGAQGAAGGGEAFGGEEGGFHALEEDLVVEGGFGGAAEGDGDVHEVRELRGPLEGLAGAHGPAGHHSEVRDVELLGEQLMLGFDVVVEGYVGERIDMRVAWGD